MSAPNKLVVHFVSRQQTPASAHGMPRIMVIVKSDETFPDIFHTRCQNMSYCLVQPYTLSTLYIHHQNPACLHIHQNPGDVFTAKFCHLTETSLLFLHTATTLWLLTREEIAGCLHALALTRQNKTKQTHFPHHHRFFFLAIFFFLSESLLLVFALGMFL